MKKIILFINSLAIASILLVSCNGEVKTSDIPDTNNEQEIATEKTMKEKVAQWKEIKLSADLSSLTDNQKDLLKIFIQISEKIDDLYWEQMFGNKQDFLSKIKDPDTFKYAQINYGPWDRLAGRESFMPEYKKRPLGVNFYPKDVKYLPFISLTDEAKLSAYTLIKRDNSGELYASPYHKEYEKQLKEISDLLLTASEKCDNSSFKTYLIARSKAVLTDDYYESDVAWMNVKDNKIDFLVGPVETDQDMFIHIKAAYESYLLIRDDELTEKAQRYASLVGSLQKCLPMNKQYKEVPMAVNADFGVYDVIFYGGRCNSGGKTISINRPYDTRVLREFGSRKLQFKNSTEAKFNSILKPIADVMIVGEQLEYVSAESFFETNMLYEISEKLGFNKCLDGKPVKDALKDYYQLIEKVRSDIVRLYVLDDLVMAKEMTEDDKKKHYVGYLANLFRIVRLGDEEPQAKANMVIFNYFKNAGAVIRNAEGKYSINFEKTNAQVKSLTELIHKIEEDGDYATAKALITDNAQMKDELKTDLKKVQESGVPIDIIFKQGTEVLGL